MYDMRLRYDLSFVSPGKRPPTKPRIVFTIKAEHLGEIERRLRMLAAHWHDHAVGYCYPEASFTFPVHDLFGNLEFGYGRCGFVTIEDDMAHFHVELGRGTRLYCCTLAMKLLAQALAMPVDGGRFSNQLQQVDLEMRCDRFDPCGYNHAVGGYVSSRMTGWLREQARKMPEGSRSISVPEDVVRAMRATWCAVSKSDAKRWARECCGRIMRDGRFGLECFGNACDLAIYPDGTCGRMDDPQVRFSCHNLDTAAQQVTLIAGLAKLCQIARQDE